MAHKASNVSVSHAMPDYPRSLVDVQRRFPGEAACANCLAALRWPQGFPAGLAAMTGPGR